MLINFYSDIGTKLAFSIIVMAVIFIAITKTMQWLQASAQKSVFSELEALAPMDLTFKPIKQVRKPSLVCSVMHEAKTVVDSTQKHRVEHCPTCHTVWETHPNY